MYPNVATTRDRNFHSCICPVGKKFSSNLVLGQILVSKERGDPFASAAATQNPLLNDGMLLMEA